jgi:RNA polymerase sigma factor (sigma-70 family)
MQCAPLDFEQDIIDLLTRMTPRLRRITASFRIPAAETDDLLQEACLALVRHWTRIECPEAWLTRTLSQMCYVAVIRRRRAWLQYLEGDLLEALAPVQPPAQAQAELFWDLKTLAGVLPRRHRHLLLLRYGFGMSPAEVAAKLGYCRDSIRKISVRSLARLRHAAQNPAVRRAP